MVTLLGPDGRPINRALLSKQVAAPTTMGVRATHHEGIASGLTPERLARILRNAQIGNARDYLTLAEEMEERYLHYASQVQTRRLAIEGVTPTVEAPPGTPTKIVDAVHELVEDPAALDLIGELTDGIAKGYAVAEPIWEYERKLLRPVTFVPCDQRFFQFDRLSLRELRLARDGSLDGDPIEKAAMIRHMPRTKSGIPLRRGFARAATWAFMLQSFALKDWAAFAEIYGIPMRVGKYHPGASDGDKAALLRAVARIASDAAAIIPQGMELEFIEADGAKGEAVFGGLLDYVDKQVSKLVVGQTMTADDGSSMAQAEVHDKVRIDIKQADCRQLAVTLNRDLIEYYVAFNFGPQDSYPRISLPVPEPEDLKELTEGVARLLPYGFKVGQRQMREKLGLSEPEKDDELLGRAAQDEAQAAPDADVKPVSKALKKPPGRGARSGLDAGAGILHPARCGCAGCRSLAGADGLAPAGPHGLAPAGLAAAAGGLDPDAEMDALAAEELADWEELADPLFAPLRDVLASASSYEEVIARMPEIAARMSGARLAEVLARLTAVARGLGDVTD